MVESPHEETESDDDDDLGGGAQSISYFHYHYGHGRDVDSLVDFCALGSNYCRTKMKNPKETICIFLYSGIVGKYCGEYFPPL